ncbi:DUF222 domain-containing protein [Nakamurella sp. YIM 132087]|uniref:DUF222 domain-containing protein n=1 Tax=Nakamurella alba TaxID=2665158 RepID=A0A7K1FR13_9ACTN|nr:DUF222 domain-containing protein [Nakamurella alba]MTD16585.1 DUF222 domain-containing protein [Nakamurella alba]
MTASSETAPAAQRAEDALRALSTLDPAELSGRTVIDGIAAGYQAISYLQAVMQGWMVRLAEPGVIPSAEGLLKHPAKHAKHAKHARDTGADEGSAADQDAPGRHAAGEDSRRAGSAAGEGPGGQGVDGESTGADQDSADGQDSAIGEGTGTGNGAPDDQDCADGQDSTAGQDSAVGEDTGSGVGAGAGQGNADDHEGAAGRDGAAGQDSTAGQNSAAGEDPAAERVYDLRASNPDSQAEFFDLMDTLEQAKARQDMAGGEIVAALVLSPKSGNIYVQRALALVRELPDTLELLREGVLDQTRASMIHKYACKLNDLALWCEFERRALKIAPRLAPAKLEYLLKRIVTDLEPEDAAEAEKRAFNRRCTGRYDLDGAMARFYADLTAENAQLVQQLVDQIARTMGNAGGRTLEQCRADAFAAIFEQLHTHGTIDLREILAAAAHVAAGGDMPDDDEYEDVVDEPVAAADLADETEGGEPDDRVADAAVPGSDDEDESVVEEADCDTADIDDIADVGDSIDGTAGREPDGDAVDAVEDEGDETAGDESDDLVSESAADAGYQSDGDTSGTARADTGSVGTDTDPSDAVAADVSEAVDNAEDSPGIDADSDTDGAVNMFSVGDGPDNTGVSDAPADVAVDQSSVGDGSENEGESDDPADVAVDGHPQDDDNAEIGAGRDTAETPDRRPADIAAAAGSEPENRCDSEHPLAQERTGCSQYEPPDTDQAGHSETGRSPATLIPATHLRSDRPRPMTPTPPARPTRSGELRCGRNAP